MLNEITQTQGSIAGYHSSVDSKNVDLIEVVSRTVVVTNKGAKRNTKYAELIIYGFTGAIYSQ